MPKGRKFREWLQLAFQRALNTALRWSRFRSRTSRGYAPIAQRDITRQDLVRRALPLLRFQNQQQNVPQLIRMSSPRLSWFCPTCDREAAERAAARRERLQQ